MGAITGMPPARIISSDKTRRGLTWAGIGGPRWRSAVPHYVPARSFCVPQSKPVPKNSSCQPCEFALGPRATRSAPHRPAASVQLASMSNPIIC